MGNLLGRAVIVPTRLGALRVEFTARGVASLWFCRAGAPPAKAGQQRQPERLPYNLSQALCRYAAGQPVKFRIPLDLTGATSFQRRVWRVLRTIPFGETRSYVWVARRIGQPGAARAVGNACGANPVPILIPCHRVVASDGSLGGFSAGLKWKRQLLALEHAEKSA
jgi:methylated-DNA-[protein]-cysteine S-methyltransferase